ncbi:MAG: penicillin-binding transpeptidase domain-containing protein [Micrococcales bacterium]|nr:penicillin-binding transpeptidase domain-containing protein [Micrococcales bacterium]MCL2668383.1 penicillin-binding transpeptidase domain-containing protein [Micrococcales bacterium]
MSDEQMARRLRDGLDTPQPKVVVDPATVLRKARRRRTARVAALGSTATAVVAGVAVALVVVGSATPDAASIPTTTASGVALPTTVYASDRHHGPDGTVTAEGTLLATVVPGQDGACEAADAAVAGSGYFCDWVTQVLLTDPVFGKTEAERRALVEQGGLTVTTTLDPAVQTAADEEVKAKVPVGDPSGVVQAMAVVEPGTGEVKALAQSTTYVPGTSDNPGETSHNINVAQPYYDNDGFQPGSTFQAFTLLAWLEAGHSLSDVVNSSSQSFKMDQFTSCDGELSGTSFSVSNSPPTTGGPITVADATRGSVNTAFMNMATQLSLCTIMQRAADLGVVQANPKKDGKPIRDDNGGYVPVPFSDRIPVNVIGTDNTTPLAMAGAYAAFAAEGVYCTPVALTRVVDHDGEDLPVPDAACHQAIDPAVANTIAYAMSGVWEGTMKAVDTPGFPAAGATGTSNNSEYTWFVGFTPRLSAAVVTSGSLDGFVPANKKTIGGQTYGVVYGNTISGPTWKRFVVRVLANGPNPAFAEP